MNRLPKNLRTRVAVEGTTPARCKCAHLAEYHNLNNRLCTGSVVCGCADYRPDDGERWTPARFREEYDAEIERDADLPPWTAEFGGGRR